MTTDHVPDDRDGAPEPLLSRPRCYAGRWSGDDGRLIFEITADEPPMVSAHGRDGREYLSPRPAKFRAATAHDGQQASARLDNLVVELGTPNLGSTLQLLFAVENDGSSPIPFQWLHVPDTAAADDVRLHLDQGGSYYEAVLGPWDDFVESLHSAEGDWLRPWAVYQRESLP